MRSKKLTFILWPVFLALAVVGLALGLANLLQFALPNLSLFLFLSAVVLAALYGGILAGSLAALLSTLSQNYFFQVPKRSFFIHSIVDAFELSLFLGVAILLSLVGAKVQRARRVAEEAVRQREEIIAVVSHDLKNPLTSIIINADLGNRQSELKFPSIKKYFDSIRTEALRMEKFVSDLLDSEKIKGSKLELVLRNESAEAIVQDAVELLAPLAARKAINVEVGAIPRSLVITCDRERIRQVFSNLLGNAVKFTPENGRIKIELEKTKSLAKFRVSDSGPGIAPSELGFIFQRYWQSKSTSVLGTGLGLAIAKGIVEAHGGQILAESYPGQGAVFSFTLPTLPFLDA